MPETVAGLTYGRNLISRRILRFASRAGFVLAAAILLLFAGYRFTQMWLVPEVTIAIPRETVGYVSLFSMLAQLTDSDNLKLQVRALDGSVAVADALEESKVDFAVVRSDRDMPRNGLTAAILRNDLVLFFRFGQDNQDSKPKAGPRDAPNEKELQTPKQLAGRRLGVVGSFEPNRQLVEKILEQSGVGDVKIIELEDDPNQIAAAVIKKEVDAIAIIASSSRIRSILKALSNVKPTMIPVNAAELVADIPLLDQTSFTPRSVNNEFPEQEIQVPSVSWRLVAGKDVERATVLRYPHSCKHYSQTESRFLHRPIWCGR